MSKERFAERQADVRASTSRLAEAVAQPESELIRDATIQRFEFTFEVIWKTMKLYLERQGYDCGGPRSTLKKTFAENLIPTSPPTPTMRRWPARSTGIAGRSTLPCS